MRSDHEQDEQRVIPRRERREEINSGLSREDKHEYIERIGLTMRGECCKTCGRSLQHPIHLVNENSK